MSDKNMIQHLCDLGRLTLTEAEMASMSADMEVIIGIMDSIKEVEMDGDIYQDTGIFFREAREDKSAASYETEKILENAKKTSNNYFEVPKLF